MLEIFGYLRDPFAWRVRLTAEEKGIAYQWIPSDISYPDQRASKFNPMGRSPIARHENLILTDAFNIQLYIDEAFPGRPLQPASAAGRAELRMFVASLEPMASILQGGAGRAAFSRRAFRQLDDLFASINTRLERSGQPWLDGDQPGLRDISFLPLLSDLEAIETSFPLSLGALLAYWQRATAYPSFQKTGYRNAEIQGQR